jgi:TolA-binding protein
MTLLDQRLAGVTDVGSADVLKQMSRPERELVDDTFRVMSVTFSYMDGYRSIDEMLQRRVETGYADLLYMNLGDLYLDKERYIDAAKTYAAFVARDPVHPQSPGLQVRVVEAYTLAKFPSLVLDAKRDYVARYGLDSDFWMGRSIADWPEVVAHLKTNLTDLAAYDHAKAQEDGDAEAYERAAQLYRRYLEFFPEDPDSAQRNFLLADILFELQRFDEATEEYLHTAYNFGPHEKAAEAGYAALVSARKFEDSLSGVEKQVWRTATISNALQFADVFPEHEQAAAVLTTVAEELFSDGERERAVQVAGLVITLQPPAEMELERTAWSVIAHAKFDMEQYAEAEQAYYRLQGMPMVDDATRAEIDERIAASVYRQAEQAQAAGDVGAAVDQFMRVAEVQPGSEFAPTAVYDAAALLITNRQWPEAANILERFRTQFPNHRFNDDATQKLAVAYEEAGEKVLAGAEYERIAALASLDTEIHREALWRAADLYEEAGTIADRQRVYVEIVTRFPAPLSESIEARQYLADLAKESGNWSERREWLGSIVTADATAAARTDRSRTLAARASLELAKPVRDAFITVRLTNPLKESLKLKKERMELALAAYGTVAEYGVAEVTTAATFEIADLYYRLSKDLMDSERPASLSAEELEQYDILLEEQAFPFEEKAIEIFIANANRAAEGIYDPWVRKSFSRLAELMPARYAKSERSESLVAQLD